MAIRIVKETERLEYKQDISKIYYRRISGYQQGLIQKRHTKKGKPDWNAVTREMMEYIVLDWENVEIEKDEYLPFSKDMISNLPQDDQLELLELAGASDIVGHENKSKNLKTSSSGK